MSVLYKVDQNKLAFHCPGCGQNHVINVTPGINQPVWRWNGSMDKPSFQPSVLATWREPNDDPKLFDDPNHDIHQVCHSFVTDGKIHFLGDCSHAQKNQILDLVEW